MCLLFGWVAVSSARQDGPRIPRTAKSLKRLINLECLAVLHVFPCTYYIYLQSKEGLVNCCQVEGCRQVFHQLVLSLLFFPSTDHIAIAVLNSTLVEVFHHHRIRISLWRALRSLVSVHQLLSTAVLPRSSVLLCWV